MLLYHASKRLDFAVDEVMVSVDGGTGKSVFIEIKIRHVCIGGDR